MDRDIIIDSEILSKILKILGLESEDLKSQFARPSIQVHDAVEDFKILILTRGIVDKFSSKPRQKVKIDMKTKETEVLQQRLETESFSEFSAEYQDLERTFSGNNFLLSLHKQCKNCPIFLNIPDSIILFASPEPVKLWTSNNQVHSKTFHLRELRQELSSFKSIPNNSSFVLRIEYHSSKSMMFECFFYEYEELDDLMRKIEEISYFKTPVLISAFVKFKGSLPCKTRAVLATASSKIYFIGGKEEGKHKEKGQKCWVTRLIPARLLESLQFSAQELELFQWGFKCKVIFPIRSKTIYFEKDFFQMEFVRYSVKVLRLLKTIIKIAVRLPVFVKFKKKLGLFRSYLSDKIEKLNKFISKTTTSSQTQKSLKKKWLKTQFIKLSMKSCKIYQITNQKKHDAYNIFYKEICKVLKPHLKNTHIISGCVADFIESNEGIFLIKLLKVTLQNKKYSKLPIISSTKHISLFSATEGSGFVKGKMNRQRLCCGDYCSLLKRNDFETKEKIEFLMKHYLEYAGTLFELLKLQDLLNINTVNHLLDRSKRPITPITQHMQYKVLRKIILEDRYDKYSLRSLILNLPSNLVRELNLILESGNDTTGIEIKLSNSQSTQAVINKKLTWEFELVPVCDKCYKIYSKRIKI